MEDINKEFDPYIKTYWQMAENRIFYLDDEITENALVLQKHIIDINTYDNAHNIDVENRQPIKILIDSPGGYLLTSLSIANTIEMSKTPIYTINVGEASSGASLVFMAGHKRYAMKYSCVLIHSGNGCLQGSYEQTVEQQKSYQKQVNQMYGYILSHTDIPDAKFKKMKSKEWYMDANEQIEFGVADYILDSLDIICE